MYPDTAAADLVGKTMGDVGGLIMQRLITPPRLASIPARTKRSIAIGSHLLLNPTSQLGKITRGVIALVLLTASGRCAFNHRHGLCPLHSITLCCLATFFAVI